MVVTNNDEHVLSSDAYFVKSGSRVPGSKLVTVDSDWSPDENVHDVGGSAEESVLRPMCHAECAKGMKPERSV